MLAPFALAANTPPKLTPIQATFVQKAFATTYSASATDPDGDKLTMIWQLSPPTQDLKCNKFATLSPTKAIWHHGDQDGCNHAVQGPRGHKGTVLTLSRNTPGQIVSWQLQFGDGQRTGGSGKPPATVAHTYAKAGTNGAFLVVVQQQQYGGVQYIVPRGGLAITIR